MKKNGRGYFWAAGAILALGLAQPLLADDQLLGTALGAGVGGYVGSQFGRGEGQLATTAAGVFVGGLIGNELARPSPPAYGSSYSAYDASPLNYQNNYVPNYVAPPAPEPATYIDQGDYCREYSQTIRIGNEVQESYGTACLQSDGSWRIVQ